MISEDNLSEILIYRTYNFTKTENFTNFHSSDSKLFLGSDRFIAKALMACFSRIFYLLFMLFSSGSILCKEKNESDKISRTSAEKKPRQDIHRVSRGIIKRPEKPRISNDRKRVRFADQVLDDTVGAEPLDSKITTKWTKKENRNMQDGKFKSNDSNTVVPYMKLFGLLPLVFIVFYLH